MKDGSLTLLIELLYKLRVRSRSRFIVIVFLAALGAFLELLTLFLLFNFLSLISNNSSNSSVLEWFQNIIPYSADNIIWTVSVFLVTLLATSLTRVYISWKAINFVFAVGRELGEKIFSNIIRQDYMWFIENNSSESISIFNKLNNLIGGVINPSIQAIVSFFFLFGIIISLLIIDIQVTLFAFTLFISIYALIAFIMKKVLMLNSKAISTLEDKKIKFVTESMGSIVDIILNGTSNLFNQKYSNLEKKHRDSQAMNNFLITAPKPIVEFIVVFIISIFMIYLFSINTNIVNFIPIIGVLMFAALKLLPLFQTIYNGWSTITTYFFSIKHVIKFLDLSSSSNDVIINKLIDSSSNDQNLISSNGLSFCYKNKKQEIINNLSFTIKKGENVLISGDSGCGKSTLMYLLLGLMKPTSGLVSVLNQKLDKNTVKDWHHQIAYVQQSIYLMDDSVLNNITFFSSYDENNNSKINKILEITGLTDIVSQLPEKLNTRIGENGKRLSGGQKQRIGIARALFKEPKVLMLDEATNALDKYSEELVLKEIRLNYSDLTIIGITHGSPKTNLYDKIIKL